MAKAMSEAPEQGLAVDELIELLRDRARDHGGDKLLEAAAAEIDRLSDLARRVEGDAWIPCSERLPEHYEHVEVYPPYEDRVYNFYAHRDGGTNGVKAGNWYHNDSQGYDWQMWPTHWRPLPEAPLPLDAGEGVDGG